MGVEIIFKNIRKVRQYKPGGIKSKDVKKILEVVSQSPLLENSQAVLAVIINSQADKALLKSIAEKRNFPEPLDCLQTAPYILLIFADVNYNFWQETVWMAISLMSVFATATGCSAFPVAIPATAEINRAFNIPTTKRFIAALPVGEALEVLPVEPKKKDIELVERYTQSAEEAATDSLSVQDPVLAALAKSSVFSLLAETTRNQIARGFLIRKMNKGELLLKRGEPPQSFFLIVSGTCEVIGNDSSGNEKVLAVLRDGDCFGEMSILCQEPVSATVRGASEGTMAVMQIKDFLIMLEQNPSLNLYFTRLLAVRLRKTNLKLVRETIIQGITGQLSAISLAEITQTIDASGRSGILHLESLRREKGLLGFRNGRIQYAQCGELKGDEAVYFILSWPDGQFNFTQGEFLEEPNITRDTMGLLMEGYRRIDETRRIQG